MRDLVLERWLTKHGYTFEYRAEIPLDKVLLSGRERFNPRVDMSEKLTIDEHVDKLVCVLEGGGEFEAITLRLVENGCYEVLQGHHRTVALKKFGKQSTDAYIVDATDNKRISFVANWQKIVEPFDPVPGAYQYYREFHSELGLTIPEVAKVFDIRKGRLQDYKNSMEALHRLNSVGFKYAEVKDKKKCAIFARFLAGIPSDVILKEALELVLKFPQLQASETVKALRDSLKEACRKGEDEARKILRRIHDTQKTPPKSEISRKGQRFVTNFISHMSWIQRQFNKELAVPTSEESEVKRLLDWRKTTEEMFNTFFDAQQKRLDAMSFTASGPTLKKGKKVT